MTPSLVQDVPSAQDAVSKAVDRMLREVLGRHRRKRDAEFFIKSRKRAMAVAKKFLDREEDAEDAVFEAYAQLLAGKTTQSHFFRLVKQIAVNRLMRTKVESQVFEHLEPAPTMSHDSQDDRLPSSYREDQDPLENLVREEEICEAISEVMRDRRRCGIRSRCWWRALTQSRRRTDALYRI